MLKALLVLVVILTVSAVELMAAQKNAPAKEQQGQSEQLSTTTNETNNCVPAQQKENSADSVQGWHKFVTWPGSWETWALIVTFGVIAWQAFLMRIHGKHMHSLAKATFEQAKISRKALVAQFRPKIVVRRIELHPSSVVEFDSLVDGKWEIRIDLVNKGGTVAHIDICTVEAYWESHYPKMRRAEIGKHEFGKDSLSLGEMQRLILPITQPDFRTNLGVVEHVAKRGDKPYEWPVCVGYILYTDDNGHQRETEFDRRWDIASDRFIPSDDPEAEYSD